MQHAIVSPWMKSSALTQTNTATLNERLALALAGSHQIAFDWHIPNDLLHFNGELEGSMRGTLLDVTRVWQSRDLPSLMHEDDKEQFRIHLHEALKGNADEDTYYRVEIRLRDTFRGWRWISIRGKIVERDAQGRAVRMVGTFSDIDDRKRYERELADRERLKSAILTAAIDCIVTVKQQGEIISFNEAAEHTFGYMEKEVLGMSLRDMLIPSYTERSDTFETDFPLNERIEISAIRSDGSSFPIELAIVPLPMQENRVFAAFIRDISDRKWSENLQLGENRILDSVANGASLPDILYKIKRFAEAQLGDCTCCITPKIHPDRTITESERLSANHRRTHSEQHTAIHISRSISGKDGKLLGTFMLKYARAVKSGHAEQLADVCTYLAGLAIESRMSEERIRYLAHHDGLTSLPNRFLFKEYFDLALKSAKRRGKKFAVFFVDLDKFKEINDTLGHDAGDEVLRVIARRLRTSLRHTDKIARMGGDEFYVLIEELNNSCHAAEVASKLLAEASRPIRIGNVEYCLSASIGISIYPDDGSNEQMLLQHADYAMYRAKKSGKNAYRFFSPEAERAQSESALAVRHALLAASVRSAICHE